MELESQGDIEASRSRLREAILADDSYAVPYNNLAMSLLGEDRIAEADSLLRISVALDTTYHAALFNYGHVLEIQNQKTEAAAAYAAALRQKADFAGAANQLAALWVDRGEPARAIDLLNSQLQRLAADDPDAPYLARNLARAQLAAGDVEAAWQTTQERSLPDDESTQELLAAIQARLPR
jgi:Tfp pilus assembly protein PilF